MKSFLIIHNMDGDINVTHVKATTMKKAKAKYAATHGYIPFEDNPLSWDELCSYGDFTLECIRLPKAL